MKKLVSLLIVPGLFLTFGASAQSTKWVKTLDEQVNCKKISLQESNLKIVLESGEKKVLPQDEVLLYCTGDQIFKKLPIYIDKLQKEVFMEFIKARDELSLYKYTVETKEKIMENRYFVYKANEFYIGVGDGNREEYEKYFFVQLY